MKAKAMDIVDLGLKEIVRGAPFDFDGDTPYQGEAKRNITPILNWAIGHLAAINVSLLAIKLMLIVVDGGANAIIAWAALKLFGPLLTDWGLSTWYH